MIRLTKKILKDHWLGLSLITATLFLYSWFVVSFYPNFEKIGMQELVEKYPKALMAFFGGTDINLSTFEGFLNMEYLSFMWVIIVAGYLIAFVTSEISKEIERGTIELLLSLPISRLRIIFIKWLNMALIATFLSLVTTLPIIWLSKVYDVTISSKSLYMVTVLGFLFFLSIGSFTFAIAVLFNDRSKAVFIPIAILLFGYVWDSIGKLIDKINDYRFISVFYYFDTARALAQKEIGINSLVFFGGIIIVSSVFAFIWFSRRDFAI